MSGGPPDQIAVRRVYTGRVLNLDVDTVRYPDGSEGQLEMIRHPGAAAVVPLLTSPEAADPQVLLIRQYRYAAGGKIWEVPAGRLDPGESPEGCARRELLEEAGLETSHLERLTIIHTTPGFTDERIHLFAAWDLKTGSGRPESDEFIEAAPHPMSRVLEMIRVGGITDAKTIVALLYFAGFRLGL